MNYNSLANKYLRLSKAKFKKGDYNQALKFLKAGCILHYDHEWQYALPDGETILDNIASNIRRETIKNAGERIVFYDAFCIDNRALTQQYLQALIKLEVEFLYITTRRIGDKSWANILSQIETCPKASLFSFTDNHTLESAQQLYDEIINYGAKVLLMQMLPYDTTAVVAFNALKNQVSRYQINLTDHAFWIGTKCLDYNIEFRNYGRAVSEKYRGITSDKEILLPFYPYVDEARKFNGFQFDPSGKVVLFSGGALYKINDVNNTFLSMIVGVLNRHKNVIFVFAGNGDSSIIRRFIKQNRFEDRFFFIGERKDINEVIKRCDIYINTYPMGGGLMCQMAALNSKPVLSLVNNDNKISHIENIVCQLDYQQISYSGLENFMQELDLLINDSKYREQKGESLNKCVIDADTFAQYLQRNVIDGDVPKNTESSEEESVPNHYSIRMATDYTTGLQIMKVLGVKAILSSPCFFLKIIFTKFLNGIKTEFITL